MPTMLRGLDMPVFIDAYDADHMRRAAALVETDGYANAAHALRRVMKDSSSVPMSEALESVKSLPWHVRAAAGLETTTASPPINGRGRA